MANVRKDIGDQGANKPRGAPTNAIRGGEGGGPAGVERSGGPRPSMPETGVPEGMVPDEFQITPEEKIERDTDDFR